MPFKDPIKRRAYAALKARRARLDPEKRARRNEAVRKSYAKNKERRLLDSKIWREEYPHRNRASYLVKGARNRATAKGIPFTLNTAEIAERIKVGICEVTGLPLKLDKGLSPWSPSLDRHIPELGYTNENVRIVCWLYNSAKGEFTDEDVLVLAKAIVASESKK